MALSLETEASKQPLPSALLTGRVPHPRRNNNPILVILQQPFQWLNMLSRELNATFVLGIILTYGLSIGFSGSYFRVVSDYYWKDTQKVQPSVVQLYMGFYFIPWLMKPVWGLLTDVFPIQGYRRRPYFIAAGIIGGVSALMVASIGGNLPATSALILLVGITAGMAIADVTIDACIARNSIEIRALAPDMQSLCGFCSSVGSLIGYSVSGLFVHRLGAQSATTSYFVPPPPPRGFFPQAALGLLAIPPAAMIILGFVIYEQKISSTAHPVADRKKVSVKMENAMEDMVSTLRCPQVWKPSLYMFLSLALNISTHEGQFFWYTDHESGPAFSQEFVGMINAVGALASIAGVLIYHKFLKNASFRNLLFFAQLFFGAAGIIDLFFILRWNLRLGLPDYLFVMFETCVSHIISRIRWIPMIVLSTKLCPIGIEGTFFALLMCIDSLGQLSSKFAGGIMLHWLHVSRTDFTYLWLAIFIRNCLRFGTLGLVFLVPNVTQSNAVIIPCDFLSSRRGDGNAEGLEAEALQLVPRVPGG